MSYVAPSKINQQKSRHRYYVRPLVLTLRNQEVPQAVVGVEEDANQDGSQTDGLWIGKPQKSVNKSVIKVLIGTVGTEKKRQDIPLQVDVIKPDRMQSPSEGNFTISGESGVFVHRFSSSTNQ